MHTTLQRESSQLRSQPAICRTLTVGLLAGFVSMSSQVAPIASAQVPAAQSPADRQLAALEQQNVPLGIWRAAAPMHERREYAAGIRLPDGRILAISGHPLAGKSIASAELYDPATGKWNDTGSLRHARNGANEATLLRDGRVLLAGGHNNAEVVRAAELFDPATGMWSDAGNLSVARDPTSVLLGDGRVLVSGGIDWYTETGKVYSVAEIFDPATDQWTATGELRTARFGHRAVLLDDGRVFVVGGFGSPVALLAGPEIYDPSAGSWQAAEAIPQPRYGFGLVKLSDGRVLVAGGFTGSPTQRVYLNGAVIYDPATGHWSETQPMQVKRVGFSTTLLADGRVLVLGGGSESGNELKSAELFDPGTGTWHAVAAMSTPRRNHRAALLPDGSVLVIGGSNTFGHKYLTSCEIFSF